VQQAPPPKGEGNFSPFGGVGGIFISGTGSNPLFPQGWHRAMRLTDSHIPFKGPCFFNACIAYSEHVGVYLHAAGISGEIQYL
jgi:hypothetical protein